jgi:hypothetical protein
VVVALVVAQVDMAVAQTAPAAGIVVDIVGSFAHFVSIVLAVVGTVAAVVVLAAPIAVAQVAEIEDTD